MTDRSSRRRFIQLTVAGATVLPLAARLGDAVAQPARVSETAPQPAALGYKNDAAQAPQRKDATQFCQTCALYSGKAGAADGPCSLFGGQLVAAKGWCTAWNKRPS
jgi:hypothetical protein